jgi:hypothetical protein
MKSYLSHNFLFRYDIEVRNGSGTVASETEQSKRLKKMHIEGFAGSRVGYYLAPGTIEKSAFVVNEFSDVARPGDYSIQIQRSWHHQQVKSNVIKITVTA